MSYSLPSWGFRAEAECCVNKRRLGDPVLVLGEDVDSGDSSQWKHKEDAFSLAEENHQTTTFSHHYPPFICERLRRVLRFPEHSFS